VTAEESVSEPKAEARTMRSIIIDHFTQSGMRGDPDHYYSDGRKKLNELLFCLGVDVDFFKHGRETVLDDEQAKVLLSLLKSYSDPPMKLLRMRKYGEIQYEILEDILENKLPQILGGVESPQVRDQLAVSAVVVKIHTRRAINCLESTARQCLAEVARGAMENAPPEHATLRDARSASRSNSHDRTDDESTESTDMPLQEEDTPGPHEPEMRYSLAWLPECDREALIFYCCQLVQDAFERWGEVVREFKLLRDDEIAEISANEVADCMGQCDPEEVDGDEEVNETEGDCPSGGESAEPSRWVASRIVGGIETSSALSRFEKLGAQMLPSHEALVQAVEACADRAKSRSHKAGSPPCYPYPIFAPDLSFGPDSRGHGPKGVIEGT